MYNECTIQTFNYYKAGGETWFGHINKQYNQIQ